MAKTQATGSVRTASKTKRPGVHSKSRTSSLKRSKNWKKRYRGQGR